MVHSALLSSLPHAFTEVTDGDLRPGRPGQPEAAARLVERLGGVGALRVVNQVHGNRVVSVAEIDACSPGALDADAIVSVQRGVVIAVRVADCVPILVGTRAGVERGGVAAIHAGWRGTAADITRVAVRALREATGCATADLVAAIGPCISGAVYEVGPEVGEALEAVAPPGGEGWRVSTGAGRARVDLAALNADILRELGVEVDGLGLCTVADRRFWSHRRDGEAGGRQVGAIRWA